jgi:type IV secretion system protein VirD4
MKVSENVKGCSRWASAKDLAQICNIGTGKGGTVLGKLGGRIVRTNGKLNENAVFFGSPGSGKTRSAILPNILTAVENDEPLVVADQHGELLEMLSGFLKAHGYDVFVFAPGLQTPTGDRS